METNSFNTPKKKVTVESSTHQESPENGKDENNTQWELEEEVPLDDLIGELKEKPIEFFIGGLYARGLSNTDIVNTCLDTGRGFDIVKYLDNFPGLDANVADRFIEGGMGFVVAKNLHAFIGVNHTDIAHRLIDQRIKMGWAVAEHLRNFNDIDHIDIANRLIENDEAVAVIMYLKNFKDLDTDTFYRLVNNRKNLSRVVIEHLGSFSNLDINIAYYIIGYEQSVLSRTVIPKFARADLLVAEHLDSFSDLDPADMADIAKQIIENGGGGLSHGTSKTSTD